MKLSIIIPVYNVEAFLEECLNSILSQNLPENEYEIIIVNDGSTDNSLKIAENFQQSHNFIRIISQENRGLSAARNTGIDNSKGDFLCFIDSDDFILPDSLKKIFEIAFGSCHESQENLGVVADIITYNLINVRSGYIQQVSNQQTRSLESLIDPIMTGLQYIGLYNYNNSASYYLIKKDYINKINLRFAEGKLCEDGIFTLEVILNAEKICHIDIDVYCYVQRPNSITTTVNPERVNKIIDGFENAITVIGQLIDKFKDELSTEAFNRIRSRRQSYVFFLLIRLLKMGATKKASQTIKWLKKEGQYPIKHLIGPDYHSKRIKRLLPILNNKFLYLTACRLMSIKRKLGK